MLLQNSNEKVQMEDGIDIEDNTNMEDCTDVEGDADEIEYDNS
jgi:hypothetical protein